MIHPKKKIMIKMNLNNISLLVHYLSLIENIFLKILYYFYNNILILYK